MEIVQRRADTDVSCRKNWAAAFLDKSSVIAPFLVAQGWLRRFRQVAERRLPGGYKGAASLRSNRQRLCTVPIQSATFGWITVQNRIPPHAPTRQRPSCPHASRIAAACAFAVRSQSERAIPGRLRA